MIGSSVTKFIAKMAFVVILVAVLTSPRPASADVAPSCSFYDDYITCAPGDVGKPCAGGGDCYLIMCASSVALSVTLYKCNGMPAAPRRRDLQWSTRHRQAVQRFSARGGLEALEARRVVFLPVGAWLRAFLLTCVVELPIVVGLTRHSGLGWGRRTLLAGFAQLMTHPVVWYVFPSIRGITPLTAFVLSELFAWLGEAAFYAASLLAPRPLNALGIAALANGASLGAGFIVWG